MPMICQDVCRCRVGDWVSASLFPESLRVLESIGVDVEVLPEVPAGAAPEGTTPASVYVRWVFNRVPQEALYPGEPARYERIS
jgi:hypothetical protein